MYRKISDLTPRGSAEAGFTLIEALVALVAGGILLAAVSKFYKDSYHVYNLQEQITERNQNAHYALEKASEILQQAGADLPDSGWNTVATLTSPPTLVLGSNPGGGVHFIGSVTPAPPANKIPVSDTSDFRLATHVLIDYKADGVATLQISISGKINGSPNQLDTIVVSSSLGRPLSVGDIVYAYRVDAYLISGNNLVFRPRNLAGNDIVLAENIDSLGFIFKKTDGANTLNWSSIRSATLTVRARTASSDPRLTTNGGYRSIILSTSLLLRNKV